jgi:hypothetical protein
MGISWRKFATHMKVSRTQVASWRKAGILDPAVLPDGSVDVEVAEHCIREHRKTLVPRKELIEQRAAHLAQRIVAARTEVDELDAWTIPAVDAQRATQHMMARITTHLNEAARRLADPNDMKASAHALLAELTALDIGLPDFEVEPPAPTFDDPRAELEYLKAHCLKLKNELASGDRVWIDDVGQAVETTLAILKSQILNMPARFTPGDDLAAFLDTEVPQMITTLEAA